MGALLAWFASNWQKLTLPVLGLLLGLFLASRCTPTAPVANKQPLVGIPAAAKIHDTVAVVKLVDRIVVRRVFVPRIGPVVAGKTNYLLKTDTLVVAANCDSMGLRIDSLAFSNRQTITVGVDKKGNGTVQVTNSSPYVKTDSVGGYRFRVKQLPRLGWGVSAGIGLTQTGPQPYVGFGLVLNLGKRK